MLRVSRALELRIGLRAELRAGIQGGDPLDLPGRSCSISLRGQYTRCCKAFGRAFGRAFVELRTELRAELLQGFGKA